MSFTPEQIKEIEMALISLRPNFNDKYIDDMPEMDWLVKQLKSKLTRPKWEPKEGEVVYHDVVASAGYCAFEKDYDADKLTKFRPLTTREAGAEGLIEALTDIASDGWGKKNKNRDVAQAALDEWFKFRSE